jgi:hypothetical protein
MPNPFFSTDLVWAPDLSFEGLAVSARRDLSRQTSGYLTAGYFPITASVPGTTPRRTLVGLQSGADIQLGRADQLHLGAALYDYHGIQGAQETLANQTDPMYASRYEYSSAWRQRGNTLFNVRAPGDTAAPIYGLVSGFRELDLTASLDLNHLLPVPLRLTGNYVNNLAFDKAQIAQRTGQNLTDSKNFAWMVRAQVGQYNVHEKGEWNASLAYRFLGSDSVLDAYTDSDFGLGGTNIKGIVLGFNYGLAHNTWLTARWMSSDQVGSYAPASATATKLSVDLIQLDLNTRF